MLNSIILNGRLIYISLSQTIDIPKGTEIIGGFKQDHSIINFENDSLNFTRGSFYSLFENSDVIEIKMNNDVKVFDDKAFINAKKLNYIKTSLKLERIGFACFSNCVSLTAIHLPKTLKEIDAFAFSGIEELKIYYDGTLEEWEQIKKEQDWMPERLILFNKTSRNPVIYNK